MRVTYSSNNNSNNLQQFLIATPLLASLLIIYIDVVVAFAPAPGCKKLSDSNPGTTTTQGSSLLQWSSATTSSYHNPNHHRRRNPSYLQLEAVTKKQTFILDGAELSYYLKSLAQEQQRKDELGDTDVNGNGGSLSLPNLAPRSPQKRNRIGAITFVTATLDEDLMHLKEGGGVWLQEGTQIVGVQVDPSSLDCNSDGKGSISQQDDVNIISINEDVHIYRDSIAAMPLTLSPADAISTAATSLLGVHCGLPSSLLKGEQKDNDVKGKIVIVGGGEYATFLAKALVGLGNEVSLVSARPTWSLPSHIDIAPAKEDAPDLINILPPAVGPMSLGFAMAIGEFDTLIDTLGDELGMGRALNVLDNEISASGAFLDQLEELHGCTTYLSTLTRSQQYVLKRGLLFARDPVIRYQTEVEKLLGDSDKKKYQLLPPPSNFGTTIETLLKKSIIYAASSNENGSHANKDVFVRGWSLSDLTELKTWPRAREGPGRFGFPVVDLSSVSLRGRKNVAAVEARSEKKEKDVQQVEAHASKQNTTYTKDSATKSSSSSTNNSTIISQSIESSNADNHHIQDHMNSSSHTGITTTMKKSSNNKTNVKVTKKRPSSKSTTTTSNPHVTTIHSASELNTKIIEPKQNCIVFLTASYCQKCKRMTPQFNRIARISSESSSSSSSGGGVIFAHIDISNGPRGKQLGKVLGVDKVPSVIVFQNGERLSLESDDGDDGDEVLSSIVIKRSNLKRLQDVAKGMENGEKSINVNALLSKKDTAEK